MQECFHAKKCSSAKLAWYNYVAYLWKHADEKDPVKNMQIMAVKSGWQKKSLLYYLQHWIQQIFPMRKRRSRMMMMTMIMMKTILRMSPIMRTTVLMITLPNVFLLTLSAHAREGYSSGPVCLSVCLVTLWFWRLLTINCWFRYELTHNEDLGPFVVLLFF